jgi:hypothetical protein
LVRLAFAGLFVNALAVACVTASDDDDDVTACDPGSYKVCDCNNGDAGTKKCNASGSGYGACDCSDTPNGTGGGGGEGNAPTTAGTNSNPYGGANNGGGGGDDTAPVAGGAGGNDVGGAGSGGEGPVDACSLDTGDDDCQFCIQGDCCTEWQACADDTAAGNDCESEVFEIMSCVDLQRTTEHEITPADLEQCGKDVHGSNTWSQSIFPTTKAVIDCVAGGTGWTGKNDLSGSSCHSLCFQQK